MTFDLAQHQRERIRTLDRRCTALEAEERRLNRLLALALEFACDKPLPLLELLCAIDGTDPARPAWIEEKDRRDAIDADLVAGERFLALLDADNAENAAA